MDRHVNILYIHGMGGGADSRIPSILREHLGAALPEGLSSTVVIRTYDFAPDIARKQIAAWMEEVRPSLVIGESMGAVHALALKGVPHLLVSPSLNAPCFFAFYKWLTLLPGVTALSRHIWKAREGERQEMCFDWRHLHAWRGFRSRALANAPASGGSDYFHAFFGTRDHYRRSGIVSICAWRRHFGPASYTLYEGTHFMEEEYIHSLFIPGIVQILKNA